MYEGSPANMHLYEQISQPICKKKRHVESNLTVAKRSSWSTHIVLADSVLFEMKMKSIVGFSKASSLKDSETSPLCIIIAQFNSEGGKV